MKLEHWYLGHAIAGALGAQRTLPDTSEVVAFAMLVAEEAAARARERWGDEDDDDDVGGDAA